MFEHHFLELLPLKAVGALSGSDMEALDRHLAEGCPICESELRLHEETIALLPYAISNRPLPQGLKEKIRNRIGTEPGLRRPVNWNRIFSIAAVIAFAALTAGIVWMQTEELKTQQAEISDLKSTLKEQKEQIAWLRDPSVQLALLTGLEPAPGAKGKMLWNPVQSRGIFYANWLPALPAGKSYQLWVIGPGGPVSGGIFDPNRSGSAVVTVSNLEIRGGALQFAVTIEPRGGLPKPTGAMVLAGKPF